MVDRDIKFSEILEVEEAVASLLLDLEETTGLAIEDIHIFREENEPEHIPRVLGTKFKFIIPATIER